MSSEAVSGGLSRGMAMLRHGYLPATIPGEASGLGFSSRLKVPEGGEGLSLSVLEAWLKDRGGGRRREWPHP